MNFARALLEAFKGFAIRREPWAGQRYLIADMENGQLLRFNEGDKEGVQFVLTQYEIFADDWESFRHPLHKRRAISSKRSRDADTGPEQQSDVEVSSREGEGRDTIQTRTDFRAEVGPAEQADPAE